MKFEAMQFPKEHFSSSQAKPKNQTNEMAIRTAQVFCQNGPQEKPLTAAILASTIFTVSQVTAIMTALGILRPSVGSGQNGAVIKVDLVIALVKHVLKGREDVSAEQTKEIIATMSGDGSKKKTKEEENTHLSSVDLIHAVSCLDPSEQDQFEPLVKNCIQQMESKHKDEVAKFKPMDKQKKLLEAESKMSDTEEPKTDDKSEAKDEDDKAQPKSDDQKVKPQLTMAMDSIPPARLRKEAETTQPRAKGKGRKPTPDCFKVLPPNIDSLYLAWAPENRMVSVDFQGPLLKFVSM